MAAFHTPHELLSLSCLQNVLDNMQKSINVCKSLYINGLGLGMLPLHVPAHSVHQLTASMQLLVGRSIPSC